jgi:hypothetical protein
MSDSLSDTVIVSVFESMIVAKAELDELLDDPVLPGVVLVEELLFDDELPLEISEPTASPAIDAIVPRTGA